MVAFPSELLDQEASPLGDPLEAACQGAGPSYLQREEPIGTQEESGREMRLPEGLRLESWDTLRRAFNFNPFLMSGWYKVGMVMSHTKCVASGTLGAVN